MNDDLDCELRSHLENEADEHRARGLTDRQARDAARRALGSETLINKEVRELSPWSAMDDALQDCVRVSGSSGSIRGSPSSPR